MSAQQGKFSFLKIDVTFLLHVKKEKGKKKSLNLHTVAKKSAKLNLCCIVVLWFYFYKRGPKNRHNSVEMLVAFG